MTEGIPDHVAAFLGDHINSVEQLEVLLLLMRSPERRWSAKELSEELRSSPESASARLDDLHSRGFLARSPDNTYHYQTQNADHDRAIHDLASCYEQRKYTVINLIFSKPVDHIRTFARAFRLRKEDKDG